MSPRVSVNIVAWNSMEYIPDLMRSLEAQTFRDFAVRVIDNGSTDGVADFLREHYPQVMVIRNVKNLGFSPAHNQGIRYAIDKWAPEERVHSYVLLTNPDIVMTPTFLERIVAEADAHPEAGSLGGKLLKAFGENLNDEALQETVNSDLLDSTGLKANRKRVFVERGAGEMDNGQYDELREVLGVSGALALYRASALEDVNTTGEYLDEDFFAYKEDVDIAWRLQERGWTSRYVPEAIAYHYRGMYGKEKMGLLELVRNRRKKSLRRSYYSTRNHWCMLVKNMSVGDWLLSWPWVVPMETARFVYVCLFEPRNARAFAVAVAWMPRMWKKRAAIMRGRKVPASELRKWFV